MFSAFIRFKKVSREKCLATVGCHGNQSIQIWKLDEVLNIQIPTSGCEWKLAGQCKVAESVNVAMLQFHFVRYCLPILCRVMSQWLKQLVSSQDQTRSIFSLYMINLYKFPCTYFVQPLLFLSILDFMQKKLQFIKQEIVSTYVGAAFS